MMLDDIADYLETQTVGTVGTDIFCGDLPDTPDNCIALFEYAGRPMHTLVGVESPGLQVRVRNTSYSTGRTKVGSVVSELHDLTNTSINSKRYIHIVAQGSPFPLGRDDNGRIEFAINFIVLKDV